MTHKKRSSTAYAVVPALALLSQETEDETEDSESSDEEEETISTRKLGHVKVKVETSSDEDDEEEEKVSKDKPVPVKMISIYEERPRKVMCRVEKRPVERKFDDAFTRRFIHMVKERGGCDNLAAQRRLTEARFMFNYFPDELCWHTLTDVGFVFHKPDNTCGIGRPYQTHFETVADALFECCKAPCSTCYGGHVKGTKYTF